MSAQRQPSPLLAKLNELLGTAEAAAPEAAVAPAPEPPADVLSDAIRDELQKAQKVVTLLSKQAMALADRFALLRAACEAARLLPITGVGAPAGHAPQLPALVALLRDDPAVARLVASAVLRFADLRADIQELTVALQRGESKPERLEAIKGKHAFLPRVHLYFQGVPLLAALFQPAAPPRPPGPAVVPGQGATTGTLSLSGGAGARSGLGLGAARATGPLPPPPTRTTVPVRPAAGPDQLQLTARAPSRGVPEEAPLAARGPVLLRALEVKIAILQGAWALAQIPPLEGPKLPAVLGPTVKAAAAVLAGDAGLREEANAAIQAFHRAKALMMPGTPPADRGDLPRLLTLLGTLPARFRDVPAIGPLFA